MVKQTQGLQANNLNAIDYQLHTVPTAPYPKKTLLTPTTADSPSLEPKLIKSSHESSLANKITFSQ